MFDVSPYSLPNRCYPPELCHSCVGCVTLFKITFRFYVLFCFVCLQPSFCLSMSSFCLLRHPWPIRWTYSYDRTACFHISSLSLFFFCRPSLGPPAGRVYHGTHRTYTSKQQPCVFLCPLLVASLSCLASFFLLCRPCVGSSAGPMIELNSFYTSKQKPCPLGTRACALRACLFFVSFFFLLFPFFPFLFLFSSFLRTYLFHFSGVYTYVPLLLIFIRNTTHVMICTMEMLLVLCGCKWYGMVHDSSLVLFPCVLALRCTFYFFSILFSSIEMLFFFQICFVTTGYYLLVDFREIVSDHHQHHDIIRHTAHTI